MAKPAISAEAIAEALSERWEEWLREGESFEAAIDAESKEATVVLALIDVDGTTRYEFEVKAPQQVGRKATAVEVAMDAADALVGQWLEEGRPRLPGVAALREYEGSPVEVTARLVRPRLQAEADRLLGDDENEGGGFDA